MTADQLLYEGKAKRVYSTEDEGIVRVEYKDSATAFNGEKKATIQGKGQLNNTISSMIFIKLHEEGIANHFVKKLSETEQLVKSVHIIPLEVVVRNIIAGSLAKRLGKEEGEAMNQPLIELYYKRDDLGDPIINDEHVRYLGLADSNQLNYIKDTALKINRVLVNYFNELGLKLVDFKLEFGQTADGTIILADEISPDTCRLWDKTTNQKLDKDVFRRDLGHLTEAYDEILKRMGDQS